MAGAIEFDLRVRGVPPIKRALAKLPEDARKEFRKNTEKLVRKLATKVRAAGRSSTKPRGSGPGGGAAATVRSSGGDSPQVIAGPHPLLFGSEYGANGRYGWYSRDEFRNSTERQFNPHRGRGSYWFWRTLIASKPEFEATYQQIADDITRDWSA